MSPIVLDTAAVASSANFATLEELEREVASLRSQARDACCEPGGALKSIEIGRTAKVKAEELKRMKEAFSQARECVVCCRDFGEVVKGDRITAGGPGAIVEEDVAWRCVGPPFPCAHQDICQECALKLVDVQRESHEVVRQIGVKMERPVLRAHPLGINLQMSAKNQEDTSYANCPVCRCPFDRAIDRAKLWGATAYIDIVERAECRVENMLAAVGLGKPDDLTTGVQTNVTTSEGPGSNSGAYINEASSSVFESSRPAARAHSLHSRGFGSPQLAALEAIFNGDLPPGLLLGNADATPEEQLASLIEALGLRDSGQADDTPVDPGQNNDTPRDPGQTNDTAD